MPSLHQFITVQTPSRAHLERMDVKPGYKQTELGLIPKEWKIAELDTLGSVIDGDRGTNYPSSKDFSESGHCLFLNAGNVTKDGFRFSECVFITAEKDGQLGKGHLKRNDIVLTTRGTVGNLAYFDAAVLFEHIRINSGMVILRNESSDLNTSFLYAFLQSHYGQSQIERLSFGSAQPQLTVKGISKLRIITPCLAEQQAIAEALSDVDALISAQDRLIVKKRAIKQGAMQELLTGRTRLPGFDGEWKTMPLGSLASIQRGASPRPIDNPIWFDDNSSVGWVRISDVAQSDIYLQETSQRLSPLGIQHSRPVSRGSLLMSICATVGRPVITQIDACIHDGFVVFDNLRADKHFMYYVLKSIQDNWGRQGQTGSQMNLNTGLINRTEVVLPLFAEQAAIATVLSDMDAEITALERRREKTRLLKQGMMQELLTGKTRLI